MALNIDITTVHGIQVAGATVKVEHLRMPTPATMEFCVRAYADVERPFVSEAIHACEYADGAGSPYAQAYEYLKSLPEFADATDC